MSPVAAEEAFPGRLFIRIFTGNESRCEYACCSVLLYDAHVKEFNTVF